MVKGIKRVGTPATQPVTPAKRDSDLREQAREFQAALRREFLDYHEPAKEEGKVAAGFDDQIMISGVRAREAMGYLHELVRLSPTFRGVLKKALADLDTLWITIGYGGGNSRSTIGAKDEKIYINLQQGDLLDLLIHECGHGLAKLEDGPLGGFGPNQRFQAVIKRELDMGRGGVKAYGTEVRPNRPENKPRRPRPN
ncbi:MAG TPA: hypothetical protein VLQ65_01510 [Saliniramus sp.]|nr:hypothetical protein [Saliniramus sp.]